MGSGRRRRRRWRERMGPVFMVDGDEEQDGDDAVKEEGVEKVSIEGMTTVRREVCRVEVVEKEVQWSND